MIFKKPLIMLHWLCCVICFMYSRAAMLVGDEQSLGWVGAVKPLEQYQIAYSIKLIHTNLFDWDDGVGVARCKISQYKNSLTNF